MNTKANTLKKEKSISTANTNWLLLIGVILVATNLRVPLTSVGALISFIRDDLNMTNAVAGMITTLPLIAFALLSPFAPKIANKIGMERTIALSIGLLIVGFIVRSITGVVFLFTGTLFIGLAIAIGNVLIPGIIKMNFPLKVGLMTGIYAVFMNIFGALGSGLSVPIAETGNFGWQGALVIWVVLAIIAFIVWLPQLTKKQSAPKVKVQTQKKNNLWRSRLAWQITLFMGVQSLIFYSLITWLPDILHVNGYSTAAAGWMVFLMQFALIPFTFIIPVIAEKMKNQVALSLIISTMFITGLAGLLIGPTLLFPVWTIMLGIAGGSAFSLSMMFFTLRAKDGKEAAELSGMAQSFGYLLAALGPVVIGALQDFSGSWTMPIILLMLVASTLAINGVAAGKDGQVSS